MLNRRRFVGLAGCAVAGVRAFGQTTPSVATGRVSVMMWTLKDRGTFAENLELVARAGYRRMELVNEWEGWSEAEWTRLLRRMRELGVGVDAIAALGLGFAVPGGGNAYVEGLHALLPIAKRLGAAQVILLSGPVVAGVADGVQYKAAVDALGRAAGVLAGAGLVGVIEPVDRLEQPHIYLDGVTEAFRMVEEVGSPALKVLYDVYHEQRTHGNLTEKLRLHIGNVGLIHVAEVPGRHQPGMGEIAYGEIYEELKRLAYKGLVAMEFYPVGDVVEVLRRAREECEEALD